MHLGSAGMSPALAMQGEFTSKLEVLIKDPDCAVQNSFGVMHKGSIIVSKEEAAFLARRGRLELEPPSDLFLDIYRDTALFTTVDLLKSCDFILFRQEDKIKAYYPGKRTALLPSSRPDFVISACSPGDHFDSSLFHLARADTRTVVSVCEPDGSCIFLGGQALSEDEFVPQ